MSSKVRKATVGQMRLGQMPWGFPVGNDVFAVRPVGAFRPLVRTGGPPPLSRLCDERLDHLYDVWSETKTNMANASARGNRTAFRRFERAEKEDVRRWRRQYLLCYPHRVSVPDRPTRIISPLAMRSPALRGAKIGDFVMGIPGDKVAATVVGGALAASLLGLFGDSVRELAAYAAGGVLGIVAAKAAYDELSESRMV